MLGMDQLWPRALVGLGAPLIAPGLDQGRRAWLVPEGRASRLSRVASSAVRKLGRRDPSSKVRPGTGKTCCAHIWSTARRSGRWLTALRKALLQASLKGRFLQVSGS